MPQLVLRLAYPYEKEATMNKYANGGQVLQQTGKQVAFLYLHHCRFLNSMRKPVC